MNVAILDDDPYQRELLAMMVETGGHQTIGFARGADLLDALAHRRFDLLLLDWVMPEMQGDAVIAALRSRGEDALPVIVVTSRDAETDVAHALRLGADDYLVKPPKRLELLARIEALARRARVGRGTSLRAGRFEIDASRRSVLFDGEAVTLTLKEFDLAHHLFQHAGMLLTRPQLMAAIWPSTPGDTRTVDTHASRLRRKLRLDGTTGWTLQSVYGLGYRLVPVQSA